MASFDDHRPAADRLAQWQATRLIHAVGWRIDTRQLGLKQPFATFKWVPEARLLIAPTSAGLPFAQRMTERARRVPCSDALVVSVPPDGVASFALSLWSPCRTAWSEPLALWLDATDRCWLAPRDTATRGEAFMLVNDALLTAAPRPWDRFADYARGRRRAEAWLARGKEELGCGWTTMSDEKEER